jgi:hypothetical protein
MVAASISAMSALPEATFYLNDCAMLGQYDVWAPWEFADVEPKSIAQTMQHPADHYLGLRVLSPYT